MMSSNQLSSKNVNIIGQLNRRAVYSPLLALLLSWVRSQQNKKFFSQKEGLKQKIKGAVLAVASDTDDLGLNLSTGNLFIYY